MNVSKKPAYTILSFARDLPNLCSLTGLFCALLSLYASLLEQFNLAVVCLLWATLFDYCDGMLARRIKNRPEVFGRFGVELDSLIDMVSYAAAPVVFLLSLSQFSFWILPVLFFMLAATALRLGFFNIYGLTGENTYTGLSLDHNILVFAFVFLFQGLFSSGIFLFILCLTFVGVGMLNLAPVPMPKYTGKGVLVVFAYIVIVTIIYIARIF